MNTRLVLALCLLPLASTGCYTKLAVNFGNGTQSAVRVASTQTGRLVNVAPGDFRKFPNSQGSLVVTTEVGQEFIFARVAPAEVPPLYLDRGHSIFGLGHATLTVTLQTNMQIYVIMPGGKAAEPAVQQPSGYPKVGQRLAQ